MVNFNNNFTQSVNTQRMNPECVYKSPFKGNTYNYCSDSFSKNNSFKAYSDVNFWLKKPVYQKGKGFSKEEIELLTENFADKAIEMHKKGKKLTKETLYDLIQSTIPGFPFVVKDISEYKGKLTGAAAITDYEEVDNTLQGRVYINFNSPMTSSPEFTTHEFTHLLQNCSELEKTINQEVKQNGGEEAFDILYNNAFNPVVEDFFITKYLQFVDESIFNKIRRNIKKFFTGVDETKGPLYPRVIKGFNDISTKDLLKITKMSREQLDSVYEEGFNKGLQESKIANKELAAFYLKYFALKEKEAYTNGFKVSKKLLNAEDKHIVHDFIPFIYEDLANYLERKYHPKLANI